MALLEFAASPQHPAVAFAHCPGCGHRIAIRLAGAESFTGGGAALRCVACGHGFRADAPPATLARGDADPAPGDSAWDAHDRQVADMIEQRFGDHPATIVELGHGDGWFLAALADRMPSAEFIGFDAAGRAHSDHPNLAFRRRALDPLAQIGRLNPDAIVVRRLTRLTGQPDVLVQALTFAAAWHGLAPLFYFAADCATGALEALRITDLARPDWQGFTTQSLQRLAERSGIAPDTVGYAGGRDIAYAFGRLKAQAEWIAHARAAVSFEAGARNRAVTLRAQLAGFAGRRLALWGTGPATDEWRAGALAFGPLPVIAEGHPGCHPPEWLREHPADAVIVPDPRAAAAAVRLMTRLDVLPQAVLIEHGGRLIDFVRDPNPFRPGENGPDLQSLPA